jgi:integrase
VGAKRSVRGAKRSVRRPPGSGALFIRTDFAGRETWYGKWRAGGRQVKRRLGVRRRAGAAVGPTRRQAEAALREAMAESRSRPPAQERLALRDVTPRYLEHLDRVLGRKPSTLEDYALIVRRHLLPVFGDTTLERITPALVSDYIATKLGEGFSPKTVTNHLNILHSIFSHSIKRGWAAANPVAAVDRPRVARADTDIRFLTPAEVDALIEAAPDDELGPTERALYIVAAFTGLRQGELAALRWRDVDRAAGLIRVRRTFNRGRFGTPKSRRSSRAVPMAARVAVELERQFRTTAFPADDDLVFCHPATGDPYDASRMRKRFYVALENAGVRRVRFHDLRHTFGTRMAAAGAPLRAIQEWMGHADYQTTLICGLCTGSKPGHGMGAASVWLATADLMPLGLPS